VQASGFAALDTELPGGGWASGGLNEILCAPRSALEWRLLAPALRAWLASPPQARVSRRAAIAAKTLLLIGPPHLPFLPGLQAAGVAPGQVVWVAAETAQERLWVTEQALKNPAVAALITWLPELHGAQAAQVRRLQSCAQGGEALSFVLRPEAARHQASAAPLRALLTPGEGFDLRVQLLKRRGPVHEQALTLPALPPGWERLLSGRVLSGQRPTKPRQDHSHALARPAAVTAASH
jgi:protein ImuA